MSNLCNLGLQHHSIVSVVSFVRLFFCPFSRIAIYLYLERFMLTGLIYLFHGDPSFTYPIPFCIPAHLPTGILSIIFIIRFFLYLVEILVVYI
jgi:hypothetical protein